jgi:Ni,Fe-hydrogenase I large subunit
MTKTVTLNPVTRIEGHLSIHAETEPISTAEAKGFRVKQSWCEGEMFRGFENILAGRDPLDAQQITQRICGVCPISHAIASVRAQEMAYGIVPNKNGRLLQNLIQAANYLHSHVLHFYHLAALDFVDVKSVLQYTGSNKLLTNLRAWVENALSREDVFPAAPFLPRFEAKYVKDLDENMKLLTHYVEALELRKLCHEMGAVFGARLPHSTAIVPGGCTQTPTMEDVLGYSSRAKKVLAFIRDVYIPDLLGVAGEFPEYFEIGQSCGNFLSFGVFPLDDQGRKFIESGVVIDGKWESLDEAVITEEVGYSKYSSSSGLHPTKGQTDPAPGKAKAYSWLKAPRYRGQVMEVGPLARLLVDYHNPKLSQFKKEVDDFLASISLPIEKMHSVLGRHVARGLEALRLAQQIQEWLPQIDLGVQAVVDFDIPKQASGVGLTEAPRGALGHWLAIDNYRIQRYQCIVPTTWNCSPRDDKGQPGPVEQAIEGTLVENPAQPMEVGRIVRSFDPCLACAIH